MAHHKYRVRVVKRGSRERFLRLFQRNNVLLWGETLRDGEVPYELIWVTDDEKTSIHYIQDHEIGLDYFLVKGEEVEEVLAELDRFLAPYLYKRDDIFAKWTNAKTQKERFWAIYHAGVAAPSEFDAQFIDLFRRGRWGR